VGSCRRTHAVDVDDRPRMVRCGRRPYLGGEVGEAHVLPDYVDHVDRVSRSATVLLGTIEVVHAMKPCATADSTNPRARELASVAPVRCRIGSGRVRPW